jgi:hypothetical protein
MVRTGKMGIRSTTENSKLHRMNKLEYTVHAMATITSGPYDITIPMGSLLIDGQQPKSSRIMKRVVCGIYTDDQTSI